MPFLRSSILLKLSVLSYIMEVEVSFSYLELMVRSKWLVETFGRTSGIPWISKACRLSSFTVSWKEQGCLLWGYGVCFVHLQRAPWGWEDGSVGTVLSTQEGNLDSNPQNAQFFFRKRLKIVTCTCNPSAGKAERGRSQNLSDQWTLGQGEILRQNIQCKGQKKTPNNDL